MAEEPDVSPRAQAWIDALGRPKPDGSAERAAAASAEQQIEGWRSRIDEIDTQLMRLLNSRSACALEIGRIKRRAGLPLYSPEREARILERVSRENPGPLDPTAVRRVFERVIDESRRLERLAVQAEEPTATNEKLESE
jgi:chorismate mutase